MCDMSNRHSVRMRMRQHMATMMMVAHIIHPLAIVVMTVPDAMMMGVRHNNTAVHQMSGGIVMMMMLVRIVDPLAIVVMVMMQSVQTGGHQTAVQNVGMPQIDVLRGVGQRHDRRFGSAGGQHDYNGNGELHVGSWFCSLTGDWTGCDVDGDIGVRYL